MLFISGITSYCCAVFLTPISVVVSSGFQDETFLRVFSLMLINHALYTTRMSRETTERGSIILNYISQCPTREVHHSE